MPSQFIPVEEPENVKLKKGEFVGATVHKFICPHCGWTSMNYLNNDRQRGIKRIERMHYRVCKGE